MNSKRSKKEFILLLFLALVFGASVIAVLWHQESQYKMIFALRSKRSLAAPAIIKEDDVEVVQLPKIAVPASAISNKDRLVGAVLTRSVAVGQWFTASDLTYDRDPSSDGALVPPGLLGVLAPSTWFFGALPKVKAHDFVHIFAFDPRTKAASSSAGAILTNVLVLRVESGKGDAPSAVLLAVSPDGAARLASARARQISFLLSVVSAVGSSSSTPE